MTIEEEIEYWAGICKGIIELGGELDLEALDFPYLIKDELYSPNLSSKQKIDIFNKIKKGDDYIETLAL